MRNSAQITASNASLPTEVKMSIHTGMLESLGLNMYTSIGKSLVEFVANSYDADSTKVSITIPFDEIESERNKILADLKKTKGNASIATLPKNIEIIIEDDGHGMAATEIEEKFLVVSRNRRKNDGNFSESGKRKVMGRKGLGKLAGFGAAEKVTIESKRKGNTYSTKIEMDYSIIKDAEDLGKVRFQTTYTQGLKAEDSGTKIILSGIRYDSIKAIKDSIEEILAMNFYILGSDFSILLNSSKIKEPNVEYEYTYPVGKLDDSGLKETDVVVHEDFNYPIKYVVKFRARGKSSDGILRGSLPANMRGARVYCNKRLAAGPTLFRIGTEMHNFHAQDYMECIVQADLLDEKEEGDLISTNRAGLKTDNEIVDALITRITALMKEAIGAHGKFRESIIDDIMDKDPESKKIRDIVERTLSPKNRIPALNILRNIAVAHGVDSQIYKEVAPDLISAINSSEVLVELVKSGTNPHDLKTIIEQLAKLNEIEKNDILKVYKGKRNGIEALRKLEARSQDPKNVKKYEKELHKLLKNNPWLIKAEYNNFLTSDKTTGEVAKKLDYKLGIDTEAKLDDIDRPDLVFVAVNPAQRSFVTIIELKSPNIPLNNDHLTQLETYMMKIENHLKNDYTGQTVSVRGYLIGNMPQDNSQSESCQLLLKKISSSGTNNKWGILTLPQLLEDAKKVHLDVINMLEKEEETNS